MGGGILIWTTLQLFEECGFRKQGLTLRSSPTSLSNELNKSTRRIRINFFPINKIASRSFILSTESIINFGERRLVG